MSGPTSAGEEQIRIGVRVKTIDMGHGVVECKESFRDGKCVRWGVRLDDPSLWSLSASTSSPPYFFPRELTVIGAQP